MLDLVRKMKQLFLNGTIRFITKYNDSYTEKDIERMRYGLEGLYLSITKLIIILGIALILGIAKELIILLVLFNIIRYPAFGFHADSSLQCLLFSTIIFISFPLLATVVNLSLPVHIILISLCMLAYLIYAPADTVKRPQPVKSIRMKRKIGTLICATVLTILSFMVSDNIIQNLIVFAMLIEVLMILPITYKVFGQPYANYKQYQK